MKKLWKKLAFISVVLVLLIYPGVWGVKYGMFLYYDSIQPKTVRCETRNEEVYCGQRHSQLHSVGKFWNTDLVVRFSTRSATEPHCCYLRRANLTHKDGQEGFTEEEKYDSKVCSVKGTIKVDCSKFYKVISLFHGAAVIDEQFLVPEGNNKEAIY